MFDLNEQIKKWRDNLIVSQSFENNDLDELEGHLREQINDLGESKLSKEEAFLVAAHRLGHVENLANEYAKVNYNTHKIKKITLIILGLFFYLTSLCCGEYIVRYCMQIALEKSTFDNSPLADLNFDYSFLTLINFGSELLGVTIVFLGGLLIFRYLITFPKILRKINQLSISSIFLFFLPVYIIYMMAYHIPVFGFTGMNIQTGFERVLIYMKMLWKILLPSVFILLIILKDSKLKFVTK